MTFTRIPILGSTGFLLLQLLACSAKEPASSNDSGAPKERLDSNTGGSGTDLSQADHNQQVTNTTVSPCAEPFDLEHLKWLNTLQKPHVFVPTQRKDGRDEYTIKVGDTWTQILPGGCPTTHVLAYGVDSTEDPAKVNWSPGATFEMTRGTPARVNWINTITVAHPLDSTLASVPIITHVHGLEVGSESDGFPGAAFTASSATPSTSSDYPNSQPATTLWYHDHALGITRLNVYAGLAGMYIIRDPPSEVEQLPSFPDQAHEMPLVIQNKSFDHGTGALVYPASETTLVVNGKVWPSMNVDRTRYRFRMLNADNGQTFKFSLKTTPNSAQQAADAAAGALAFTVIGSDGGYLAAPLTADVVRLAPGERADVLIDFSALDPDQTAFLTSDAGDVVRFTTTSQKVTPPALPAQLDTKIVALKADPQHKRTVTLLDGPSGPLLNGEPWAAPVSETPVIGSTEDWDIVNISSDDHPIHLHLVQYRVIQRRKLKLDDSGAPLYDGAWNTANAPITLPLAAALSSAPKNPDADGFVLNTSEMTADDLAAAQILATESGWKDTVFAPSGFVTTIRVRWAPEQAPEGTSAGTNAFLPLDPSTGAGYVWHCHILEHEDMDMMRPLQVVSTPLPVVSPQQPL